MNKLDLIAARRADLIERAARQRAELGAVYSRFQHPAAIFDKGYAIARGVKSHSGIVIGAAAALILVRPRAIGKLTGIVMKAVKFAAPVVQLWLSRKLPR